jgi:bifunctional enzyme CysN/CysC
MAVGSVDDGKSTLIGRLLYDSQALYDDQVSALVEDSRKKDSGIDFSLVTDGLKAEREQAITIDVAYRYFSTERRKFIIADTPGHEFYTRNMVTAASVSELAVLLLDARKGVLPQTCRHAYIAVMLGIRHIIVAVNKMDLVRYDHQVFQQIRDTFLEFAAGLGVTAIDFIPVSAKDGDNIVSVSSRMPWYKGTSLLEKLETAPAIHETADAKLRFPVQLVIRPNQDFRGYAGQIVSGRLQTGQAVIALPSRQRTEIAEILSRSATIHEAVAPMSVAVTLRDHIELGRGDMLVDAEHMPPLSMRYRAKLIWMSEKSLGLNVPYLMKHTTQTVCGSVIQLCHKIDTQTLHEAKTDRLRLNEIGEVEIETHKPIFGESYGSNRQTGSFVVIDPVEGDTLAAGILLGPVQPSAEHVTGESRHDGAHPRGLAVWFTGLSGAGKTTICGAVYTELLALGFRVETLDGDLIRRHMNSDLGFSRKDRDENVRRLGFLAELLVRNGVIVLVSAISPYRDVRDEVRSIIGWGFVEVYVNAPLEVCEQRDPKGLYKQAREKKLTGFTGVDDPYEPPMNPQVECKTDHESLKESTSKVVSTIRGILRAQGAWDEMQVARNRAAGD